MRTLIHVSFALLTLSSTLALAGGYDYQKEDLSGYNLQPDLKVSDDNDYSRTGHELYFFGGYAYTKRFLSSTLQSIHDSSGNVISYSPKEVVPSGFHGLQIGVGKAVSIHFDLQASYFQNFEAKKSSVYNALNYRYKVKSNGVMGDIAYIFNPYDQFQVDLQVGAMLTQTTNSVLVNSASYHTVSDSTKIDPTAGLEFFMKFTRNLGIRMSALYVLETQGTNSHGDINGIVALNYTV